MPTVTQTISGITTGITLRVKMGVNGSSKNLSYNINGGAFTALAINGGGNPDGTLFNVNNGDVVGFKYGTTQCVSTTVTVKNASDGDTLLDSFTVTNSTCP